MSDYSCGFDASVLEVYESDITGSVVDYLLCPDCKRLYREVIPDSATEMPYALCVSAYDRYVTGATEVTR